MPELKRIFLGALAALIVAAGPARADFVFQTPGGSTAGGQPVNATATFVVSAGFVEIYVTNLQNNPTSDIQAINGIQFVLSSGQIAGTLSTSSALHRTVNSDKTYTDGATSSTSWNLNGNVASGIELTSIGNSGGSPTLIGGPDGSNLYSNANGSIAGSGPHNPFLAGTAYYKVNISGLLANATIDSMRFEFGTAAGTNVTGILVQSVPEPTSVAMALTATASLGVVLLRRRVRTA